VFGLLYLYVILFYTHIKHQRVIFFIFNKYSFIITIMFFLYVDLYFWFFIQFLGCAEFAMGFYHMIISRLLVEELLSISLKIYLFLTCLCLNTSV
jgi:hypothetical protein